MAAKELPARPDLEQYKKQAKDLAKRWKSGNSEAIERTRKHHPRLAAVSGSALRRARLTLADAQLVIAREHGFESWPKFARRIKELTGERSQAEIWKSAENAVVAGDATALEGLLRENPEFFRDRYPPSYARRGPVPDYAGDARSIIAREHHFESWAAFVEHKEALENKTSPVAQFEAAVQAVITGDVVTLGLLLRRSPELTRARSARNHHGTLLHYVGANGVEGFRQKTPKNAVRVAEILLGAGAEVDAVAEMYGGSTTLGLVATSIHPLRASVQEALIDVLLNHGAAIDHPGAAGNAQQIVNGCLANGRGEAAEFLARRGARLDLEAAAGVGRLDLVNSFFNEDGGLNANATNAQMKSGFNWACEYGRTGIVEFLLQRGIDVGEIHRGSTGLHWAAYGGHVQIVKLLLGRQAPVDAKDETWGTTPLGWALYGWANPPRENKVADYYEAVALLVAAGAMVEPEWLADEKVRADPRMLAALSGDVRNEPPTYAL